MHFFTLFNTVKQQLKSKFSHASKNKICNPVFYYPPAHKGYLMHILAQSYRVVPLSTPDQPINRRKRDRVGCVLVFGIKSIWLNESDETIQTIVSMMAEDCNWDPSVKPAHAVPTSASVEPAPVVVQSSLATQSTLPTSASVKLAPVVVESAPVAPQSVPASVELAPVALAHDALQTSFASVEPTLVALQSAPASVELAPVVLESAHGVAPFDVVQSEDWCLQLLFAEPVCDSWCLQLLFREEAPILGKVRRMVKYWSQ